MAMEFPVIAKLLEGRFPQAVKGAVTDKGDPWIEVSPGGIVEVLAFLKEEGGLEFDLLLMVTGVDRPDGEGGGEIEVVYHLASTTQGGELVLKVRLPREKPLCPTVTGVHPGALWHERETYDMLGVEFTGHPDLRRILCPEDWVGHPLRKDYEYPEEYGGISAK